MKYFYIETEEQKGPFLLEELILKHLNETTLIWHEGLEDWTEAINIPSLESYLNKESKREIPSINIEPPRFQSKKPTEENQNKKENINNPIVTKRILFISSLTILIFVAFFILNNSNSGSDTESNSSYDKQEYPKDYNNTENESDYHPNDEYKETPQSTPHQQNTPHQQSEDEIRENLFNKEIINPTKYLSTDATYRVNLLSNTIVEGTIYNNATIAGFKNIDLTAKFYSKTNVLLGSETFLIMDFVQPGSSTAFKYKISGWWDDIDHWTLRVNSAESY